MHETQRPSVSLWRLRGWVHFPRSSILSRSLSLSQRAATGAGARRSGSLYWLSRHFTFSAIFTKFSYHHSLCFVSYFLRLSWVALREASHSSTEIPLPVKPKPRGAWGAIDIHKSWLAIGLCDAQMWRCHAFFHARGRLSNNWPTAPFRAGSSSLFVTLGSSFLAISWSGPPLSISLISRDVLCERTLIFSGLLSLSLFFLFLFLLSLTCSGGSSPSCRGL